MRFRGGRQPCTELILTRLFRLGNYSSTGEESTGDSEEEGGAERERERESSK